MIIDTRTIKNFLTNDEILEIESVHTAGLTHTGVDRTSGYAKISGLDRKANYHWFKFYEEPGRTVREIILPKLQSIFHTDIYIDDCHILESFYPYIAHTDGGAEDDNGKKQFINGYGPAWTLIIPLDTYISNTIIFNQSSNDCKVPRGWIEKYNPPVLNSIDDKVYDEYLADAVDKDLARYLSIEEIFPWKKGSLSATSRCKFHCSDYFINRGISCKRAIVMWTSLPLPFIDI